jgi:hypothetical protein
MKIKLLGGKIGFLEGEKETWGGKKKFSTDLTNF